jgi:predicted RNase H-like HicB family nuclease
VSKVKQFTALIYKDADWYVAQCLEIDVVSQGHTIEEARANIKEAVELYLESFGEEILQESTEVILTKIGI